MVTPQEKPSPTLTCRKVRPPATGGGAQAIIEGAVTQPTEGVAPPAVGLAVGGHAAGVEDARTHVPERRGGRGLGEGRFWIGLGGGLEVLLADGEGKEKGDAAGRLWRRMVKRSSQ